MKTESLGRVIARALRGGEVLALIGALGAGKTALVQGIAEGLGTPPHSVSSPTFVLVHEYRGRLPLIHVDLYRLQSGREAEAIGVQDYFDGHTITAIEWADKFPSLLPPDRLEVRLMHRTPTTRRVTLSAQGPDSVGLLARITEIRGSGTRKLASRDRKKAGRRKALSR